MPLYICRWQNGDFSAVSAPSRKEAIALLDEMGNAEMCDIFTVRNFMVHFRLKDKADDIEEMLPVELQDFGDETHDVLCDRVYPTYSQTALEAGDDWQGGDEEVTPEQVDAALTKLNAALEAERKRPWGKKKLKISSDPEAAKLQESIVNLPKVVAEKIVKEHRHRKFREMPPSTDKIK